MPIAPARTTSFDILLRVEKGGFASDLLLAQSAGLSSRDAGLAAEIVFGVLRFRGQLDYLIEFYAGRPRKLDVEVRTALRMAIYQLRYLERIPAHAAVTEAVELVKRAQKKSATGFVNAILRQVDRDPVAWPSREVEFSCPEWMLARWERQYGAAVAAGIAKAALEQPEAYFRGPDARQQDIGAQAIVPLLQLQAGQTFLDLCAAPGNKTAQALETGVQVTACDLHFHRIRQMKPITPNLLVADGTKALPFGRQFDRILVDAPCTGTGTLGRNPEIKWKLSADDLADLPRRQTALLANARAALAPGGLMVYATCSLEPEENQAVVAAAVPEELIMETLQRFPGREAGDGFYAAVIKSDKPANG